LPRERVALVGHDVCGDAHAAAPDARGDVNVHRPCEDCAHTLDGDRRQRRHAVAVLGERRAHERERVAGDRLRLGRVAQHRGQERARLLDRADADACPDAVGLPCAQAPDCQLHERHLAEPRLDVQPVDVGVALARRLLERHPVLGRPAVCDPLAEGGAARCQLRERQRAELPATLYLAVEGVSVSLADTGSGAEALTRLQDRRC
jgi:hypothetical protein